MYYYGIAGEWTVAPAQQLSKPKIMPRNPLVLIDGYSDKGESFRSWRDALIRRGYAVENILQPISICSYQSLTNELTVKDVAEGFDRALRTVAHLDADQEFDAIVHSTGMLVIRSWLTTYPRRRSRLKRLIGLAPATFGSPLAHKGRSFLGSIFKGNKDMGPDFLESGDLVLNALELGSRFTWELTHHDLLGKKPFFGKDAGTPYKWRLVRFR
jgi:triacylglycerol esterase/lipase EstA (alpha/beta hydrolase family)